MRQRTALTIAMVLTTFVLLIAGGVIGRLAVAPTTNGAEQDAPVATAEPSAQGLSPEREAEYQRTLQTANARLEEANRQLEEAYRRLGEQAAPSPAPGGETAAPPATSPSAEPLASSSSPQPLPSASPDTSAPPAAPDITAEQAAAAARAYVGGGTIERVRLEEEQGQLVYEVRFTDNSRVYVDPVSGSVIYARLEERDDRRSGDDD